MGVNIQTIKEIRLYLKEELQGLYPEHEINGMSAIIVKDVLRSPLIHNLALPETPVQKKHVRRITGICSELKKGRPLQYILGYTEFYNCTIRVDRNTLIPRPETEELVDLIIKENRGFTGLVLDAGTGSGCIAVALAINLPGTSVKGFDISEGAIIKARENATLNKARVTFLVADIFNPDPDLFPGTGIIVSNPPYIRESEKKQMAVNILGYEPPTALFVPDSDPLVYYRAIIKLASRILVPPGKVYFEINEAMGKPLSELLITSGYASVEIINDLNNKERIIKGIKNE
jgi:release factor glutamine methyltransferase